MDARPFSTRRRSAFVALAAGLLASATARAGVIDGSDWPNIGPASPASTGLATVSDDWIHHTRADDQVWGPAVHGTAAAPRFRYLQLDAPGGEHVLGVGSTPDPLADPGATFVVRHWRRAVVDENGLAHDIDLPVVRWGTAPDTVELRLRVRNDPTRPDRNGFVTWLRTTGATAGAVRSSFPGNGDFERGFAEASFDEWFEIAISYHRGATAGTSAIHVAVNGHLVRSLTHLDTSTFATPGAGVTDLLFTATDGLTWHAAPPITSGASETLPTVQPAPALFTRPRTLTRQMLEHHWNEDDPIPFGRHWEPGAGTATATAISQGAVGFTPGGYFLGVSGAPGSDFATRSIAPVGPLPYCDTGDATFLFHHIHTGGSGTVRLALRNLADTEELIAVQIANGELQDGDGNELSPQVTIGDRWYDVLLHLNSDGTARWTLVDLTKSFIAGRTWWSGVLPMRWTPQDVGRIELSAQVGAGGGLIRLGAVHVCEWWVAANCDSLVHTTATGIVPDLAVANHVPFSMCRQLACEAAPGGAFPNSALLRTHAGYGRMMVNVIAARAGRSRKKFTTSVVPGLAESRGMIALCVDGGSINDVSAGHTVAQMSSDLEALIDACLPANRVFLTTMIRRPLGGVPHGWTEADRIVIEGFNEEVRRLAVDRQLDNRIMFADVAARIEDHDAMFDATVDDVHFLASSHPDPALRTAGDVRYAQELVSNVTPPCGLVDLDGSGSVGFMDLNDLLGAWGAGSCPAPPDRCPGDVNGDGQIGFLDLTGMLNLWGPCP